MKDGGDLSARTEPRDRDANVEHTTWSLRVVDVDDTRRRLVLWTRCTHSHQLEP
jgi:hypothetical protein